MFKALVLVYWNDLAPLEAGPSISNAYVPSMLGPSQQIIRPWRKSHIPDSAGFTRCPRRVEMSDEGLRTGVPQSSDVEYTDSAVLSPYRKISPRGGEGSGKAPATVRSIPALLTLEMYLGLKRPFELFVTLGFNEWPSHVDIEKGVVANSS